VAIGSVGQIYTWTIAHTDTPLSINDAIAPTGDLLATGMFVLNTSGFTVDGETFPLSDFQLESVPVNGGDDIDLSFNGTPEPGTTLLVAAGLAPMLMARRRRKVSSS
jgi:hypothetical protein